MNKTNEKEYLYSDEEEAIRGNADAIKEIIKLIRKSKNLKDIKNYVEAIDLHIDNIISEIDMLAEV